MSDTPPTTGRKTAGAFDVRTIIGALLGVYGVILLVMGLVGDTADEKTGDVNANLWVGIVLIVVSAIFFTWWRLRPIVVSTTDTPDEHDDIGAPPSH